MSKQRDIPPEVTQAVATSLAPDATYTPAELPPPSALPLWKVRSQDGATPPLRVRAATAQDAETWYRVDQRLPSDAPVYALPIP